MYSPCSAIWRMCGLSSYCLLVAWAHSLATIYLIQPLYIRRSYIKSCSTSFKLAQVRNQVCKLLFIADAIKAHFIAWYHIVR